MLATNVKTIMLKNIDKNKKGLTVRCNGLQDSWDGPAGKLTGNLHLAMDGDRDRDPRQSTGLSSLGPNEEQKEGEHEQGSQDHDGLAVECYPQQETPFYKLYRINSSQILNSGDRSPLLTTAGHTSPSGDRSLLFTMARLPSESTVSSQQNQPVQRGRHSTSSAEAQSRSLAPEEPYLTGGSTRGSDWLVVGGILAMAPAHLLLSGWNSSALKQGQLVLQGHRRQKGDTLWIELLSTEIGTAGIPRTQETKGRQWGQGSILRNTEDPAAEAEGGVFGTLKATLLLC
ncbi:hypothetical protein U0070_026550 [Myodes glareolus]|uniref:Uncharacterized protein n=1 Tax=Myodes glareolus TaxID=447135 RepID=A0AAW0IAG8_MYOGA